MVNSGEFFHVEVTDLNSTLVDGRGEKPRARKYLHFGNNGKRREVTYVKNSRVADSLKGQSPKKKKKKRPL